MKKLFNIFIIIIGLITAYLFFIVKFGVLTLIPITLSTSCSDVDCPSKEGMVTCGYCKEDSLASSNPNAGKCIYCPASVGCPSDDPCKISDCGTSTECPDGSRCCKNENGVKIVGITVPASCNCPPNTSYQTTDIHYNLKICNCNECN